MCEPQLLQHFNIQRQKFYLNPSIYSVWESNIKISLKICEINGEICMKVKLNTCTFSIKYCSVVLSNILEFLYDFDLLIIKFIDFIKRESNLSKKLH